MVFLISDKNTEYAQFLAKTLEELDKHEVQGIAIVALINGHEELTGYWNMDLRNKLQAETAIRFDAFDTFLLANKERYFEEDVADSE